MPPEVGDTTHTVAPLPNGAVQQIAEISGYRVPPNYDSMVAKLLVHQPTRAEAFDLTLADLLLQRGVGGVVAGDDEQATGLLVEAVNDAGALRIGATAEDLFQLVDQGGAIVRWGRVNDKAGRLVDHREVLVEVDDAQLRAHLSVSPT